MNRRWMGVVAAALAIGCAKRFVVVSTEDPSFCKRCPCRGESPTCPGALEGAPRCTLAELLRARVTDASFAADPLSTPLVQCGQLVLFRESALDYEGLFAFDIKTGALVASRTGGGYGYVVCGGGYYANYQKFPAGFVFPKPAECSPFDVGANAMCAGTFALCSTSVESEVVEPHGRAYYVNVGLTDEASRDFDAFTGELIGRDACIAVGGEVVLRTQVRAAIQSGRITIQRRTEDEARRVVAAIKSAPAAPCGRQESKSLDGGP